MALKSVSKPEVEAAGEAVMMAPPRVAERLTAPSRGSAPTLEERVRRRVVIGKSPDPIVPVDTGLETVFGADDRTRIVSTEDYPWKLVCALEIDTPAGLAVGTAWFAGPKTLITAGHCVFDRIQFGGWAREIVITPGRTGELRPFGTVRSKKFMTVDRWQSDQDPDFDVAAISLEAPVFGPDEFFRVGSFSDEKLLDQFVNISGYPAAPGAGIEQYWAKNRIRAVRPRRLFYDVDTSGGQSGAPVYMFPDETAQPVVVGIHAYGEGGTPANITKRVNSAPRIIPEVVETIERWVQGAN